MAKGWINGDLVDLTPEQEQAKAARKAATLAEYEAGAAARAAAGKEEKKREEIRADVGGVEELLDLLVEAVDTLASGEPLTPRVSNAVTKYKAAKERNK